jgi:hypothetical protein
MSITTVLEVDEIFQHISFFAWFNIQWKDEFLIWNETEYSGFKMVTIPYQKVWVPDLSMTNSEENSHQLGPHPFVSVTSAGQVLWFPGGKFVANCELKMTKFPFDEQHCDFFVAPWQITDQIQKLAPRMRSNNDAKLISKNGEWEIMDFTYNSEYLTEFDMTIVHYSLHLRRRYFYFFSAYACTDHDAFFSKFGDILHSFGIRGENPIFSNTFPGVYRVLDYI